MSVPRLPQGFQCLLRFDPGPFAFRGGLFHSLFADRQFTLQIGMVLVTLRERDLHFLESQLRIVPAGADVALYPLEGLA